MRLCVACRTSSLQARLLRFARAPDGAVVFDVKGRLEGRGAYTCAKASCVRRAIDKDAFRRAFEAPVLVDAAGLIANVVEVLEAETLRGMGLARRASQLVPGRAETLERAGEGGLLAVVLARDLAERSKREVVSGAAGVQMQLGPDKEAMGLALGRGPTGVVGLLVGQVSCRLVFNLERLGKLLGLEIPEGASRRPDERGALEDASALPCGTGVGSV